MAQNIREADGLLRRKLAEGEKSLPIEGERNVLISSALPYCNNVPHLGNIIGSTLSADVFARYNRTRNRRTLYVCGTDEYGTATETQALKEGITPQELCDKYHVLHAQTYEWFEIGFDHFGRTSTQHHTEVCQESYLTLRDNNLLERKVKDQTFCEDCNRFLADRYVEGICPNCGYEDARGDQCDQCSRTYDATELLSPRCIVSPKTHHVVLRPSAHMYVKLDVTQPLLEDFLTKTARKAKWGPNAVVNGEGVIIDARVKQGLRGSPVTRDLTWGVKAPLVNGKDEDGVSGKVLYVWFDAPFGYPSITAAYTPEWRQWWFNPQNVQLYQFMGKDNVYFHTVFWPSILLGDGRGWTMLHNVSSTEYLQYESGKFSKSRNVGVFGPSAKETGIPPSVWRYHLLSTRPETADSTFSWNDIILSNNSTLLNNFGNFVNRVIKFVSAKFDGIVPDSGEKPGLFEDKEPDALDATFLSDVNTLIKEYIDAMEAIKIRLALQIVMQISARGNLYLQQTKFFDLFSSDRTACAKVVSRALNLIYALTAIVHPFMPSTSTEILRQLNAPERAVPSEGLALDILPGHTLGTPGYLFTKIEEKQAEVWRSKYGGSQAAVAAPGAEAAKPLSKKAAEKKKKADKAAAAAATATAAVVANGPKTPEVLELEKQIGEQGSKVRRIKGGDIKDGESLDEALAELMRLKGSLTELATQPAK